MNRRRLLALLGCVPLLACKGLPISVTRIEDPVKTPPAGIRYVLRNPTYTVALRLASNEDPKPKNVDGTETTTRVYDVVLKQSLGDPTVFEARTDHTDVLADTELSMTVESDGRLIALDAGATDHTADVVAAVASVVVSSLVRSEAAAVEDVTARKKEPSRPDQLEQYVAEQTRQLQYQALLQTTLKAIQSGIQPPNAKDSLERMNSIRDELVKLGKAIQDHVFVLKRSEFNLTIDGALVGKAKPDENAWVTIDLRSKQ